MTLALCPFCGGAPYEAHHIEYGRWAVSCKCGAYGPNFRVDPLNEHKCSAYQKATTAWNSRAALAEDISAALGTTRFMDPPDGGDVPLSEQVRRMREELEGLEALMADTEWLKAERGDV